MEGDCCGVRLSSDTITIQREWALESAVPPHTRSHFNGAVTEEGIVGKFQFFLLAVHDIDRIVQHDIGNPSGAQGHEDGHSRLTGLE
jgi:hypothetical protein